jgi:hypothetical protein
MRSHARGMLVNAPLRSNGCGSRPGAIPVERIAGGKLGRTGSASRHQWLDMFLRM